MPRASQAAEYARTLAKCVCVLPPKDIAHVVGCVCSLIDGLTPGEAAVADALKRRDIGEAGSLYSSGATATRGPGAQAMMVTAGALEGGGEKCMSELASLLLTVAAYASGNARPAPADLWHVAVQACPPLRQMVPKPAERLSLSSGMAVKCRASAGKMLSGGTDAREVAEHFGVAQRTVRRWQSNPKPRPQLTRKLDPQEERALESALSMAPRRSGYPAATWTLELVGRLLVDKFRATYSRRSLQSLIDRLQPKMYTPPFCDHRLSDEARLTSLALIMPGYGSSTEDRAVWDHAVEVLRHSDPGLFPEVVGVVLREAKTPAEAAKLLRVSEKSVERWQRRLTANDRP